MDIDIDVKNRNDILHKINNIPASKIDENKNKIEKHPVGIYFQNIPICPITGLASIDYRKAEELGYIKFDIINNSVYEEIESMEELDCLLNLEPDWNMLKDKKVVEQLPHIHNYYDLIIKFKPQSIDELACFLALIRPGKRHLLNKNKKEILEKIWIKEDSNNEGYTFKKSHAYAYSLMIILKMNILKNKKNYQLNN